MTIIDHVNILRIRVKKAGQFRLLAEKAGVSYHWLAKFAQGSIKNPTVHNIHKLEQFFNNYDYESARDEHAKAIKKLMSEEDVTWLHRKTDLKKRSL